ncbi:MAG: hypothetical protein L6R39_001340 [Caloplaca ligustica]|nr:MAG: hypothetical protein L6R39_001340 [Caloplaca ligustica]
MANVAAAQDADEQRRLADLNGELAILIELFPYVLPEVFREMLMRFDGRSRLEMVVNNLLSGKDTWIKGRLRPAAEPADFSSFADGSKIPTIDLFRRNSYKWAVKANLLHEFKSLSKSTVMAVLAEKNYCYTLARPVLQDITSKSWRYSIKRFFSRWSKSTDNVSEKHGMIQWIELSDGAPMPMLKETGDAELDQELHQTMLAPLLARYRAQQEASDREIAETINEEEATTADALFECGCCFGSSTFEQVASCTESAHIICFECISRAMPRAYG